MTDADNPVIYCTPKQLSFVAWQLAKSSFHLDQADLTPTPEFEAWFGDGREASSIRDLCWQAFVAANPPSEPNHGALHHFTTWWQTIVAAQPVVS